MDPFEDVRFIYVTGDPLEATRSPRPWESKGSREEWKAVPFQRSSAVSERIKP